MSKLNQGVKEMVLDKIVGKMHWHGETYGDEQSSENMEAAYELTLALLAGIYDNATLAPNAVATASGKKLHDRAIDMLRSIKDMADEAL